MAKKIETKFVPIGKVKPNPKNPRVIKDDQFQKLVKSIKEFPKMLEIRPIVLDSKGMVLGGNQRLKACQEAGLKEIPVIYAETLTPKEKERFIIADNVSMGEWDTEILEAEWEKEKLDEWGLDLPEFENEEPEALEDEFEIPKEIKTSIKLGDMFEIGPHRLLCGDSSKEEDVRKLMANEKADMVFTDPPYGVAYVGKTKSALKIQNDDVDPTKLKEYVQKWFSLIDLVTRGGAYLLATVPARPLHLIFAQDWLERGWLRQIMVWNKSSMVLGHSEYHYKHEPILFGWKEGNRLKNKDRKKTTVWDFEKPTANREHPTMKPVQMWAYGIGNHTKEGDLLYEPFSGSGTCHIASHQLNRKCYGMELDPKYCQVIIDRMKALDPKLVIKKNGKPF